jgi:hypothetical protein
MQGGRYLQGDVWQVIGSVLRADDLRVIPPLKNAAALRLGGIGNDWPCRGLAARF